MEKAAEAQIARHTGATVTRARRWAVPARRGRGGSWGGAPSLRGRGTSMVLSPSQERWWRGGSGVARARRRRTPAPESAAGGVPELGGGGGAGAGRHRNTARTHARLHARPLARSPTRPTTRSHARNPERPPARTPARPIARPPARPLTRPPARPPARPPDHQPARLPLARKPERSPARPLLFKLNAVLTSLEPSRRWENQGDQGQGVQVTRFAVQWTPALRVSNRPPSSCCLVFLSRGAVNRPGTLDTPKPVSVLGLGWAIVRCLAVDVMAEGRG
jgi:hypothetical protein